MKKLPLIALVLVLAACGQGKTSDKPVGASPSTEVTGAQMKDFSVQCDGFICDGDIHLGTDLPDSGKYSYITAINVIIDVTDKQCAEKSRFRKVTGTWNKAKSNFEYRCLSESGEVLSLMDMPYSVAK